MIDNTKISNKGQNNNLLSSLLNSTLKEIMVLLSAECGSLFLFDDETKDLVLDSFYNSCNQRLLGLRKRIGEGIMGKVADIKSPVLVQDINRDSRFRRNGFNHYQTNSFISIPLFDAKGILGILNVADKSTKEPFSQKDLELADALCKYVCMVADNILQSELLRKEKETLDQKKEELEKYASVGKLAASIVHQINNPLDGVIRYTNILLSQMDNHSVNREYLLEAKKGLSRIANITKSLLEFSQLVNSNHGRNNKYVDMHRVIEESLDLFCDKLGNNVCIRKRFKGKLPQILDMGISHVYINIIKNALDAMPNGGTLEIATDVDTCGAKIVFKDTGCGIPDEIRNKIFEPFFTTKQIDKGTGLGLAICNEIIGKYGGSIGVRSFPGKGSEFTILIPREYLRNEKPKI